MRRAGGPAALALCIVGLLAPTGGVDGQAARAGEAAVGAERAVGGDGAVADYDWTLRELDGETFKLERYQGRPLVLNVWATWCAPCVAELASLERLAASLSGDGVEVLVVSPEPAARVRSFLRRHGYRLPAAVEDQRMPASFGLRALPTTYVIAADGRVVLSHRGAADWDRPELRQLILRLVRAGSSQP